MVTQVIGLGLLGIIIFAFFKNHFISMHDLRKNCGICLIYAKYCVDFMHIMLCFVCIYDLFLGDECGLFFVLLILLLDDFL